VAHIDHVAPCGQEGAHIQHLFDRAGTAAIDSKNQLEVHRVRQQAVVAEAEGDTDVSSIEALEFGLGA
jgi:hypothetical protein